MSLKPSDSVEARLERHFSSTDPPLLRWPHLLFAPSAPSYRQLLSVFGPGGIFGMQPMWGYDGDAWIGPESGDLSGDFELWEAERNQPAVARYWARGGGIQQFFMLISSRTQGEVLAELYAELLWHSSSDYYYWIARIAEFIPRLSWAWIPLEFEGESSIIVVEPASPMLARLASLRYSLRLAGIDVYHYVPEGGSFVEVREDDHYEAE